MSVVIFLVAIFGGCLIIGYPSFLFSFGGEAITGVSRA
jgi:hypothetical protein